MASHTPRFLQRVVREGAGETRKSHEAEASASTLSTSPPIISLQSTLIAGQIIEVLQEVFYTLPSLETA